MDPELESPRTENEDSFQLPEVEFSKISQESFQMVTILEENPQNEDFIEPANIPENSDVLQSP